MSMDESFLLKLIPVLLPRAGFSWRTTNQTSTLKKLLVKMSGVLSLNFHTETFCISLLIYRFCHQGSCGHPRALIAGAKGAWYVGESFILTPLNV